MSTEQTTGIPGRTIAEHYDLMAGAVRAVLALHYSEPTWGHSPTCSEDGQEWPCATGRAITEALS